MVIILVVLDPLIAFLDPQFISKWLVKRKFKKDPYLVNQHELN